MKFIKHNFKTCKYLIILEIKYRRLSLKWEHLGHVEVIELNFN